MTPRHPDLQGGVYETEALFLNGGPNRSLILRAEDPANPPVLRFKVPGAACGHLPGPGRETWLLHGPEKLARFEALDLILDGNGPAWVVTDTYASPANNMGATDAVNWRGYYTNQTRACVWWAGTTEPALLGTVGWTDPKASYQPGRSEALGAVELSANSLVLVVTGWITPTGYSRAYRQKISRE